MTARTVRGQSVFSAKSGEFSKIDAAGAGTPAAIARRMVHVQRRLTAQLQTGFARGAVRAASAAPPPAAPHDQTQRMSANPGAAQLEAPSRLPASGDLRHAPARSAPRSEAQQAAQEQRFQVIAEGIREHRVYQTLDPESRAVADQILAKAKHKEDPVYYGEKLRLLFDTPEAAEEEVAVHNIESAQAGAEATQERLATPEGRKNEGQEEAVSRDRSRRWTGIQGDGAKFAIDRSDPSNIVVKMKVHLTGKRDDVASIKAMEDDIEKQASTRGYTFDLEFSKRSGPDVFEAGVNPGDWTTSHNWIGSSYEIAHEAHHRLGLDDRYDYIESHADNAEMKIPDRLHWFNVQIDKPRDPQGVDSLMGDGSSLLHDDVCNVAQLPTSCVDERNKAIASP